MRRALLTLAALGCSGDPLSRPDDGFARFDAAVDARVTADRPDGAAAVRVPLGGACAADAECDDGRFCDGVERCVMDRCAAGADPCDDGARCTREVCDEASRACARAADATLCADGDPCNGVERCDPAAPSADRATGCARADHGVDCNDGDPCTVDTCARPQGCSHAPRDLDGDGHVDRRCPRDARPGSSLGDDCDDGDPAVHPRVTERCDDGRDNNCDGLVDLADAVACRATNDVCARAVAMRPEAAGYRAEGTTSTFAPGPPLPCVDAPVTRATAWFRFALAAPRAVTLRLDDGAREGEVPGAVAVFDACDAMVSAPCATGTAGAPGRAGADAVLAVPSLRAGTWLVAVQTAGARPFGLRVEAEGP